MSTPASNPVAHPIRVTFFGDSVCVGQGVSIYRGWVTRIAQFLDDYCASLGCEVLVTNSSVNGRTTRQALEDMPYQVQSSGADILVVQFGLNDCNHWASDRGLPRVSLPAFRANLLEIVDRARCFGARRILLNNNHPTARDAQPMQFSGITYEQSNRLYNEAVRGVARESGSDVAFQDVEAHFLDLCATQGLNPADFVLPDGLHLNDRGHGAYYELMCPAIRRAVEEFVAAREAM